MAWLVLVLSGCAEATWAIALSKSDGLSHLAPSIVFLVALVASMAGLAYATKTLPMSTAYAVWVGIGIAGTVIYGMTCGIEPVSVIKIFLLIGLFVCIVGLKVVSS